MADVSGKPFKSQAIGSGKSKVPAEKGSMSVKQTKTASGTHRGGNKYSQTIMTPQAESFVVHQIPKMRNSDPSKKS